MDLPQTVNRGVEDRFAPRRTPVAGLHRGLLAHLLGRSDLRHNLLAVLPGVTPVWVEVHGEGVEAEVPALLHRRVGHVGGALGREEEVHDEDEEHRKHGGHDRVVRGAVVDGCAAGTRGEDLRGSKGPHQAGQVRERRAVVVHEGAPQGVEEEHHAQRDLHLRAAAHEGVVQELPDDGAQDDALHAAQVLDDGGADGLRHQQRRRGGDVAAVGPEERDLFIEVKELGRVAVVAEDHAQGQRAHAFEHEIHLSARRGVKDDRGVQDRPGIEHEPIVHVRQLLLAVVLPEHRLRELRGAVAGGAEVDAEAVLQEELFGDERDAHLPLGGQEHLREPGLGLPKTLNAVPQLLLLRLVDVAVGDGAQAHLHELLLLADRRLDGRHDAVHELLVPRTPIAILVRRDRSPRGEEAIVGPVEPGVGGSQGRADLVLPAHPHALPPGGGDVALQGRDGGAELLDVVADLIVRVHVRVLLAKEVRESVPEIGQAHDEFLDAVDRRVQRQERVGDQRGDHREGGADHSG
mmetsp:Transcript_70958/g.186030  ORF Transcript_70958/g.186030 Transcript_70958/m.186030 type:complete len:519 (+) Transcript_70958:1725-3281(+)